MDPTDESLAPDHPNLAPLQLSAKTTMEGTVDARLELRWCITPAAKRYIEQNSMLGAHVLICVTHNGTEVDRFLFPLESELNFIDFRRSGWNDVHATIVAHPLGDIKALQKFVLGRDTFGSHYLKILQSDGEHFLSIIGGGMIDAISIYTPVFKRCHGDDTLHVKVPVELFAHPPAQWRQDFVEWFFSNKAKDQCHFRKRFLSAIAFTVVLSPVVVVLGAAMTVIKAVILLLLGGLLGIRGLGYGELLHPFSVPSNIWDHSTGGSRWLWHKDGSERHPAAWFFNPIAFLSNVWAVVLFSTIMDASFGVVQVFLVGFAVMLVLAAGASVVFTRLKMPFGAWRKARREARELQEEEERKKTEAAWYHELALMGCNGYREADLASLPKNKRTITLRAKKLKKNLYKTKLCRPYIR